jgi:hypothetical protein
MKHFIQCCLILFGVFLLSSCASRNLGIGTSTAECCAGHNIESFQIKTENIPVFLGPIIVSNFSVALAEKGFQPVINSADAVITLRYEQDNIESHLSFDDFDERIDTGLEARFVARIVVEMRAVKTNEIIRMASIQRLHSVRPGDHMHTGRASIALLGAFRELVESFTTSQQEEMGVRDN